MGFRGKSLLQVRAQSGRPCNTLIISVTATTAAAAAAATAIATAAAAAAAASASASAAAAVPASGAVTANHATITIAPLTEHVAKASAADHHNLLFFVFPLHISLFLDGHLQPCVFTVLILRFLSLPDSEAQKRRCARCSSRRVGSRDGF